MTSVGSSTGRWKELQQGTGGRYSPAWAREGGKPDDSNGSFQPHGLSAVTAKAGENGGAISETMELAFNHPSWLLQRSVRRWHTRSAGAGGRF